MDMGLSVRDRPGLVEDDRLEAGERLQRARGLDHDAAAGAARHAGDDRHGHGENERAGGRDHQHGERATRIVGEEPGPAGEGERECEKAERIVVGKSRHRRLGMAGALDEADDAGIGAVCGGLGGEKIEGRAGIGDAARDGLARVAPHRQRLAGQGGFVQHRRAGRDQTVDRHHLARADQDPVVRHDRIDRGLDKHAAAIDLCLARHAAEQRRHLTQGPALSIGFERLPTGEHQRHDDAGERLADHQRARHGQRRNDVEAELAAQKRPDDGDQQHGQNRHHARSEDPVGGQGIAETKEHQAARERGERHGDERRRARVDR